MHCKGKEEGARWEGSTGQARNEAMGPDAVCVLKREGIGSGGQRTDRDGPCSQDPALVEEDPAAGIHEPERIGTDGPGGHEDALIDPAEHGIRSGGGRDTCGVVRRASEAEGLKHHGRVEDTIAHVRDGHLEMVGGTGDDHSAHFQVLREAIETALLSGGVVHVVARVVHVVHGIDADDHIVGKGGHIGGDRIAGTGEPDGEHIVEPRAHEFQVLLAAEGEVEQERVAGGDAIELHHASVVGGPGLHFQIEVRIARRVQCRAGAAPQVRPAKGIHGPRAQGETMCDGDLRNAIELAHGLRVAGGGEVGDRDVQAFQQRGDLSIGKTVRNGELCVARNDHRRGQCEREKAVHACEDREEHLCRMERVLVLGASTSSTSINVQLARYAAS